MAAGGAVGPAHAVGHRRIDGLDALRGMAIGLVMLRHAAPSLFGGAGVVGVTVFFTLSGFLITGVLVRDLERNGHVSYGLFYRNRAFRLVPALLLLLVGFVVVTAVWDPLGERDLIVPSTLVAVTYTADLPLGVEISSGLSHLWTLAVEEQFYLVWPLLLAFSVRRAMPARGVLWATAVAWLAAAVTVVLVSRPAGAYELPTSWAVTLALGGLLYVHRDRAAQWVEGRRWLVLVALAVLAVLSLVPDLKDRPLTYLAGGPLIAVCSAVLILTALSWPTLPTGLLEPLRWLGIISYAAYLWNLLITVWIDELGLAPAVSAPLGIALTVIAATVSWHVAERPAARWRARLDAARAADQGSRA